MNVITEELEIIEALLLENGIKCELNHEIIYLIIGKEDPSSNVYDIIFNQKWIYGKCIISNKICKRPDISDPNFIEKVKEFVKFCGKQTNCGRCPRRADR